MLTVEYFVFGGKANALNIPPENYGRKVETQRSWRRAKTTVEHVV